MNSTAAEAAAAVRRARVSEDDGIRVRVRYHCIRMAPVGSA